MKRGRRFLRRSKFTVPWYILKRGACSKIGSGILTWYRKRDLKQIFGRNVAADSTASFLIYFGWINLKQIFGRNERTAVASNKNNIRRVDWAPRGFCNTPLRWFGSASRGPWAACQSELTTNFSDRNQQLPLFCSFAVWHSDRNFFSTPLNWIVKLQMLDTLEVCNDYGPKKSSASPNAGTKVMI